MYKNLLILFSLFSIKVNFVWAIHQAHHSGEDFTMTSALRQAVLQPFTAWVKNFLKNLIKISI